MKTQRLNFSRYALPGLLAALAAVLLIWSAPRRADASTPELTVSLSKPFVAASSYVQPTLRHTSGIVSGTAQDKCNGFHGVWSIITDQNEKGVMELSQRRTIVRGTFKVGTWSGIIRGSVKNGVLSFEWSSGSYNSSGSFKLSTNCNGFTGRWNAITRVSRWDGMRAR